MKNLKELRGSLGILASGTLVNLLVGLGQGILIARLLGLEDFGRYATLSAFATVVAKLCDLGLPNAYSYFYRRYPQALPSLLRLLGVVMAWCLLVAVGIMALGSLWVLPFLPDLRQSGDVLIALTILIVAGTCLNILVATALATGNYPFFASLNSASNIIQTAVIVGAAVRGAVSLELFLGLTAVVQLCVAIAAGLYFVRLAGRGDAHPLRAGVVLSYGLRSQWGVLLKQMSSRFELLFVAGVLSPAQVGMFSLALSVRDAGLMPQSIYSAPLQNLLIDRNHPGQLSNDRSAVLVSILLQLGLSSFMTVGAAVALPVLIPLLYGTDYAPAVAPAITLFATIIFFGAAGICWIAFNAKGHPELTSLTLTFTGVPGPFLVALMASRFGLMGASLAALVMAMLTFVISFAGIVRLQRYSWAEFREALQQTPQFVSGLVRMTLPSRGQP